MRQCALLITLTLTLTHQGGDSTVHACSRRKNRQRNLDYRSPTNRSDWQSLRRLPRPNDAQSTEQSVRIEGLQEGRAEGEGTAAHGGAPGRPTVLGSGAEEKRREELPAPPPFPSFPVPLPDSVSHQSLPPSPPPPPPPRPRPRPLRVPIVLYRTFASTGDCALRHQPPRVLCPVLRLHRPLGNIS